MAAVDLDSDGVDAIRADGGLVHVRSVCADDVEALRRLHQRCSDRSIYLRFFSLSRDSGDRYLTTLAGANSREHHALAASVRGELVGVASFERIDGESAEFALLVADAAQHEGIGTLLLEHLASTARHVGVHRFVADMLCENETMIAVLRDLGFRTTTTTEQGTVRAEFPLDAAASVVDAIGRREAAVDAASLQPLLSPRSIAVIGAGDRVGSVGRQIVCNLIEGGFTGTMAVVNPHHHVVLGVRSVASPLELDVAPDLAVVAVPAARVPEVVRLCGVRGARTVMVLSAGFGETGPPGPELEAEVLAIAREFGMRLVGPNCVGVVNTDPDVRLNATFAVMGLRPGGLGVLAQSGAFGTAFVAAAARADLGISQFVSVGNKADVSGNDLLLFWEADPRTRVIAMYLESIGDARRLARIAHRVSGRKPILAIKSGRSTAGRLAGRSHTAAAASPELMVDALFHACGILRMDTMQEMLDAARVFAAQPVPAGGRVAIVGNSGGPGILAADAASAAGLTVIELGEGTQDQLRRVVPTIASAQNPVDLGAGVDPSDVERAIRVLLESDETDAVLTVFTELAVTDFTRIRAAVVSAGVTSEKTLVATEVGAAEATIPIPGTNWSVPVFTFPESAAAALGVAHRYGQLQQEHAPSALGLTNTDAVPARRLIEAALAAGTSWLRPDSVCTLLTHYGIPVCPQRLSVDIDDAADAAAELGYPVALKVTAAGVHKSDVAGVRLHVSDETALRREFLALSKIGGPGVPILIQPMVVGAVEAIVGAVHDDRFGSVVMLGAGGVLADLMDDRGFRLAPVSEHEADRLINGLRLARRLDGFRGAPPCSRLALRDVLVRIAALVADIPEIAELDLNPVICRTDDAVVVDARIRVAPCAPTVDPLVRRLRGANAGRSTAPSSRRRPVRSGI